MTRSARRQHKSLETTTHCKPLHCARLKQLYRLKRRAGKRITLTSAAIMLLSRLACSQPAAGEEKFHAGEAADAFKMTHLRMAYSSRDRSTTHQADFQDCWVQLIMVAATVQSAKTMWSAVGMDADLSARHTFVILSKR
jgi:hypothetical protein